MNRTIKTCGLFIENGCLMPLGNLGLKALHRGALKCKIYEKGIIIPRSLSTCLVCLVLAKMMTKCTEEIASEINLNIKL